MRVAAGAEVKVQRPLRCIPVSLERQGCQGETALVLADEIVEVEVRLPFAQVFLEPGVEVVGLADVDDSLLAADEFEGDLVCLSGEPRGGWARSYADGK